MRQTIYIDVLVSVNLLVDYFLLYAAGQLSAARMSRTRLCLAAFAGACCSCSVLLPAMPLAINALVTVSVCALMTLIAFGFHGVRKFMRTAVYVLLVTVGYAGLMLGVWLAAAPRGLIVNNGAVYIDIPPWLLVAVTAAAYAVLSFFSARLRKRNLMRSRCTVTVSSEGRQICLEAIVDTGNLLSEPFSGLPVIVAEYEALLPVLPAGFERYPDCAEANTGLRVVPYTGVGGEGVMLAFRPERITAALPGGHPRLAEAYIGVLRTGKVGRDYRAIVNPDILL